MNNSRFDDSNLEDLLKEMPKLQDKRSKDEVFAKLKQSGLFNEEIKTPTDVELSNVKERKSIRAKKPMFVAAAFVALAASMTFILLNNKENSQQISQSDTSNDVIETNEVESLNVSDSDVTSFASNVRMMDSRTGLYEDEIVGEYIFNIGFAGEDAESVPAVMKLPTEWLQQHNITVENKTYLEVYEQVVPHINEENYGFLPYHPLVGAFEEEGTMLIHKLPNDHPYDEGTASFSNYIGVLTQTFGEHYETVKIVNEDGTPAEFSHSGTLFEPIQLENNQHAYFIYETSKGMTYLSPSFQQRYDTLEEALEALKIAPNDVYRSPLIEEAPFTYTIEDEGVLFVRFNELLDVNQFDAEKLMKMFEALIFTAKSFEHPVQFENVVQADWNGLNFNQKIINPINVNEHFVEF